MSDEDEPTSFFDWTGREPWAEGMAEYGYVEMEGYEASDHAYCCFNCPYMLNDQSGAAGSPTGFWCKKYSFPDKPNGCCDGWEPKLAPEGKHQSGYGPKEPQFSADVQPQVADEAALSILP